MTRVAAAQAVTGYTGKFPGTPDQVQHARHAVASYLDGHPVTDDAVLVVSELASNAVQHSDSAGDFFTVSAELHGTYCWIEVEDAGGDWEVKPPDESRLHGLDIVEALAGPDNWGVDDGDHGGHVVWVRLDVAQ